MTKLADDIERAVHILNEAVKSNQSDVHPLISVMAAFVKSHRELHRRAQAAESRLEWMHNWICGCDNEAKYWKKEWEYQKAKTDDMFVRLYGKAGIIRGILRRAVVGW